MKQNDNKIMRRYYSTKEREKILEKTNCKCARCGKKLNTETMTVDHIFPIDKGGLNDEYNLLALCDGCNKGKSNYVYNFRDYYKYVKKSEYENFLMYNNFASFEYTRRSIAGYDEVVFKFLPYKGWQVVDQMMQRGAKKHKIAEMREKLMVPVILRKAYPAAADDIYKLIEKEKGTSLQSNDLYCSSYDVLHDIKNGCVYTLENNNNICGAFLFKPIEDLGQELYISQLTNIMEETGLEGKYIMTYAVVSSHASPVLNDVMNYFENSQLDNGWMPIYYGILTTLYLHKDKCIFIPYQIGDSNACIEFMPVRHIYENRKATAKSDFVAEGYCNVPDDVLEDYATLLLKHIYLKEAEVAEGAEEFFNKYPKMKSYFKADSFRLYGVGMHE